MTSRGSDDRNQDATLYIGNIEENVTENLIWELMLQAGPVVSVNLPKDRISSSHQGYGFVEFQTAQDADYALKIMNQIRLFGKPIRLNLAASDKRQIDIGANLFIGNLDQSADEHTLTTTFSKFGTFAKPPSIARDSSTMQSKGYGFVYYETFDASDAALEALQGQFLLNKPLHIDYALKKGSKSERHGSQAERLLAAAAIKNGTFVPKSHELPPPPPTAAPLPGSASTSASSIMLPPPPPPPPANFAVMSHFKAPHGFAHNQNQNYGVPYGFSVPPPPPPPRVPKS